MASTTIYCGVNDAENVITGGGSPLSAGPGGKSARYKLLWPSTNAVYSWPHSYTMGAGVGTKGTDVGAAISASTFAIALQLEIAARITTSNNIGRCFAFACPPRVT